MVKMNELVGIIKGIDSDNVINDIEVNKLLDWLKSNYDLKNDKLYSDIIHSLIEILEDRKITEDEKKILISMADEYILLHNSSDAKISMLNGIIEGIICDDEINQEEVIGLRKWLLDNKDLEDTEGYKEICYLIEKVLQDNILTQEEKEELMELFNSFLFKSKSIMVINYLKNKIRDGNLIGLDLIELLDKREYIDIIHKKAIKELKIACDKYQSSMRDEKIVFISLAIIALENYDGNFYDNLKDTYAELYSIYKETKIEGAIRSILRNFKGENKAGRIITPVLKETIVPKYFLPDFFEFIYDIYQLNFNCNLSDDLYDGLDFVFNSLKNVLDSNSDSIELNVTNKTYKLIKSTKEVIMYSRSNDTIIKLSIEILKIIDAIYWEYDLNDNKEYFDYGCNNWIKKYYSKRIEKKKRKKIDYTSRWKPEFFRENEKIYLRPPVHRVYKIDDYRNLKIVIDNGSDIIYENKRPPIKEIIGGYEIMENPILLNNPLGEIRYRIMQGETTIYDSNEKLYRKVIAFSDKNTETLNHHNYEGEVVFCYQDETKDFEAFYDNNYYKLGCLDEVNETTIVEFKDEIFTFSSIDKNGIIGEEIEGGFVENTENGKSITAYKKVEKLIFEAKYNIDELGIRINNKEFLLKEYDMKYTKRNIYYQYVVKLDLETGGIYNIQIFNLKSKKTLKNGVFEFALDRKLNYEVLKLDDDTFLADIKSEIVGNQNLEISLAEDVYFGINFICDKNIYRYFFVLPILLYRIDDDRWHTFDTYIWGNDIKHDTKLSVFGRIDNKLIINDGKSSKFIDELEGKLIGNNIYSFNIGFLQSIKNEHSEIKLKFNEDRESNITIYNKCIVDIENTFIKYNQEKQYLNICLSYFGKNNLEMSINDDNGTVFSVDIKSNYNNFNLKGITPFKKYRLVIHEKKGAFLNKNKEVIYEKEFAIFDLNHLEGRQFKIDIMHYSYYEKDKCIVDDMNANRTFILVKKRIDNKIYEGVIFTHWTNEKYYLRKINPVEIEFVGNPFNDHVEAFITKDGDSLLLNMNFSTIQNNVENHDAYEIYNYSIKWI